MAKTNTKARPKVRTHEGAPATIPKAPAQLLRQVATCMLWEDTFYEKGSGIADGIAESCAAVPVDEIARVAVLAREDFKLRHAPLFLLAQLNKRRQEKPGLLAATTERVIQRADELTELLAVVEKCDGGKPIKKLLSHGLEKGLARAFRKFDAYHLAKYNRNGKIKLRDVLFLVHAKPKDETQAETWRALVNGMLEAPDTWEVALSKGSDKKATWERLLSEKKLGYIALLRNLRNMTEAKVDAGLVEDALLAGAAKSRALPFRFIAAAKHAPAHAQALSDAMLRAIEGEQKLAGETLVVVDVSGSMDGNVSAKSEISRWEAAAGVAILAREVCQRARVFTFSYGEVEVPNLRGIPLVAGIARSQDHGGTRLAESLRGIFRKAPNASRVIVFTDEQSHDGIIAPPPECRGYLVNVASYKPALMTGGGWTRINGFSERIVDWIRYEESEETVA